MVPTSAVKRVRVECAGRARWLKIREVCGEDEETVSDMDTHGALDLLDRLLVGGRGADVLPGQAAELTTSERDFALAAIYLQAFGSRIRETVRCGSCHARFDFDLDLELLLREKQPATGIADGFRFPTGEDELAVAGMENAEAERALFESCVTADVDRDAVTKAMDAMAPLVDAELLAHCPECGATNTIAFDIQTRLLGAIAHEQDVRASEIHHLAVAYGWSLTEILRLSRTRRRELAAMAREEGVS